MARRLLGTIAIAVIGSAVALVIGALLASCGAPGTGWGS